MWEEVAREIGASFSVLADDLWELEIDGHRTRVLKHILELDNPVTLEIAARKPLVYRMLADRGLRVPDHVEFRLDQLDRAYAFAEKYPRGSVVKPANGTGAGLGVSTHIRGRKEVRRAAILASLYCPDLLIEPMVYGECYRILMLRGRMIHAVRRPGLKVQGTGTASIAQLIAGANAVRLQNGQPPMAIDRDCQFCLESQRFTLESVPAAGTSVLVKATGEAGTRQVELRTVYTQTVTDLMSPSLRENAQLAARVVGSEFVGVDFITPDPSVPLEQSGGVLNEVNTTPGLHHHYISTMERRPQPAIPIADVLLSR
jgi:cyanophycin synthetase